ncbi:unnamed protein product [Calypogeia fissa]
MEQVYAHVLLPSPETHSAPPHAIQIHPKASHYMSTFQCNAANRKLSTTFQQELCFIVIELRLLIQF